MSEEKTIVILNNYTAPLTLPYASKEQKVAGAYTLKIGRNKVPVKVIQTLTAGGQVDFKRWEELDWIMTPPNQAEELTKPEGPGSPPTLKGYPVDEKNPENSLPFIFIRDETDQKVLRKWLVGETRAELREAINAKLDTLKAAAKAGKAK